MSREPFVPGPVSRSYGFGSTSAFSLLELLIVLAIIAVLAALLLPGLARARAIAHRLQCQNNLRQISLALNMYANDHKWYPPIWRWQMRFRPVGAMTTISLWNVHCLPYLGNNTEVFNCPRYPSHFMWTTDPSSDGIAFPYNIEGDRPFCYGANRNGAMAFGTRISPDGPLGWASGHDTRSKLPEMIRSPADMIALGEQPSHVYAHDSGIGKAAAWGVLISLHVENSPKELFVSTVHQDGFNVGFFDGHVEWNKWWKLLELSETATRRWNFDNEPHPEFWRR